MSSRYVWIGEAYKDGERIERVVHKHEDDARKDIEICAAVHDPDEIRVEKEKLHLGQDTEWHIER